MWFGPEATTFFHDQSEINRWTSRHRCPSLLWRAARGADEMVHNLCGDLFGRQLRERVRKFEQPSLGDELL
jgi:hypothetical protein